MARYDGISFTPPEKVRKMNRFFGRNARFADAAKDSPAWASWLLWGGAPGAAWSRKVVGQMDAADRRMNARVQGVCVSLARSPATGDESPWNVLAYEVALRGRGDDVALTRRDFAEAVANFERFGREIPVVLYHADTNPAAHPAAAAAHAWVVAMRVGDMMRAGKRVATLEGRFRWVNASTRAMVESGELAFGSITLVQHATDEESGEDIGSMLWSFSLTNNPALTDLPRIAAERSRGDAEDDDAGAVPAVNDSPDGPAQKGDQRVAMETSMQNMMTLAARLGIAAASEDDATARIAERAQETAEVRRALSLSADAGSGAVAAKLSQLSADAAKLPALAAQVEALELAAKQRRAEDAKRHIDALVAADPKLSGVRPSLEFHAAADFEAFTRAYPLPVATVPAALSQRVTALSAERTPDAVVNTAHESHSDRAHKLAMELTAKTPSLTYRAALAEASRILVSKGVA